MSTKILVVDDEEVIREALGRKLLRAGFDVVLCKNGVEALDKFSAEGADLVIIDIVMPEMNGLAVCQRIREISEVPIVMLSAQAVTEDDIVDGLNAGADEYLIKPVRLNEFVARVRAMLRRTQLVNQGEDPATYDDGYLHVDAKRRQVMVDGQRVHLTPTEFKLLVVLLEHAGRVVPLRVVLEQVWGQEYVDDIYYPRVYVSQLRRKIERDPGDPVYILTEHRVGYRFEKQAGYRG